MTEITFMEMLKALVSVNAIISQYDRVSGLRPSASILKKIPNITFQKLDLFPPSYEWETSTLLGALDRANINLLATHVSITTAKYIR
jgi:hypothetical protein